MGMIAEIFRNDMFKDCSNGGISSNFTSVTIVNVEGPFEPTVGRPAVFIKEGAFKGTIKCVPAVKSLSGGYEEDTQGFSMGGTYVATSDSRFSKKCRELVGQSFYGAVPFHDRYEG